MLLVMQLPLITLLAHSQVPTATSQQMDDLFDILIQSGGESPQQWDFFPGLKTSRSTQVLVKGKLK